jgi:hypothetical protein
MIVLLAGILQNYGIPERLGYSAEKDKGKIFLAFFA